MKKRKIVNVNNIHAELNRKLERNEAILICENNLTEWFATTKGKFFARSKHSNHIKVLKWCIDINGYPKVYINNKLEYAHRLVAIAFIPNPLNLPQVNHKRGTKLGKLDCSVENLEWVTEEENLLHARKFNLNKYARLTEFDKLEINKMISNDPSVSAYRVSKELDLKYFKVKNYMNRYID